MTFYISFIVVHIMQRLFLLNFDVLYLMSMFFFNSVELCIVIVN